MPGRKNEKPSLVEKNRFIQFISMLENINSNEVHQKNQEQGYGELIFAMENELLLLKRDLVNSQITKHKEELKTAVAEYKLDKIKSITATLERLEMKLKTDLSNANKMMGR